MTPEILLLAGIYDFSADLVASALRRRGIAFLRINREQLPQAEIGLDPVRGTGRVVLAGHAFDLTRELRAVWFRAPVFLRNVPAAPLSPQSQLEKSQWMALIRGLTMFDEARWINHPRETFHAESKLVQLAAAVRAGFAVPPTLVSNDADAIRARYSRRFAMKPLDTVLLRDGDDDLFAYMSIIGSDRLGVELKSAPVIAQELVEGKVDVRVTIIGEHVDAVRILARSRGVLGDWRRTPKADLSYEGIVLPAEVEASCRRLLDELGLVYGAIDLAETAEGYLFFEVNPTGEFGWLISEDRPYDEMIAALLAEGQAK